MKWFLVVPALMLAFTPGLSQEAPPPPDRQDGAGEIASSAPLCPYCRGDDRPDEFCPRCGRLAGLGPAAPDRRFWGDAPYVLAFPPTGASLSILSEVSETGLVREEITLLTGDRYSLKMGRRGAEIEGRVSFGSTAKEAHLEAKVIDISEAGRLVAREIRGKISGESDRHLYRRIDYLYSGEGLLDTMRFGTWLYADGSDREKRPGSWLRHAVGDIRMVREGGRLARIETTWREGRRSLRGEPEYAEPVVIVESVLRAASGAIDRLVPQAR